MFRYNPPGLQATPVKHLSIPQQLEALRHRVEEIGGTVHAFAIEPPAGSIQIELVEREIGRALPAPLRRFFNEVTAGVDVSWTITTGEREFHGAFDLKLSDIPVAWTNWTGWRDTFAHPEDHGWPSHMNLQVYEAAFPLLTVANGDQVILFDDDPGDPGEVMYLDHESSEGIVFLAGSFERFMRAWVPLACPGPDFSDLAEFYDVDAQEITLDSAESRAWLKHLAVREE